jgi:iron complex outermembrane receptor protein
MLASLVIVPRAHADAPPTGRWLAGLDSAEASLRKTTVDAEGAARQLADLRGELNAWIAAHPDLKVDLPAQQAEPVSELNALRAVVLALRGTRGSRPPDGVFYLGRVDVTVTDETPAPGVTVLPESEPRVFDRSTYAGLFALAPGVTASKAGSRNEDTVYLRGFDLRQTPLYVDGIPVYVPYDGYVDLARFLTSDVGEVRVSRGLTSNLYGPNTLGGALNVVSRRPAGRLEGLGSGSLGSGDQSAVDVQLGTRRGSWYATAGGSYGRRDTYPLSDDFQTTTTQPDADRENAYSRDRKFNGGVGYVTSGGSEYALRFVSQHGEKGSPPYAGADSRVRPRYWQWPYLDKDSVYGIGNTRLGARSWLGVRAYYDNFKNALYSFDDATYTTQARPSSFRSRYDDYTLGTTIEVGQEVDTRLTWRAVGHFKQDVHREANDPEPQRRFEDRLFSGGVEGTASLATRLSLVAGVSVDSLHTIQAQDFQNGVISDFPLGDSTGVNPQASLVYGFADGDRVHLGVSRKTRLPSIKDRYSYRLGLSQPNPDLKAEHATSVEAGYEALLGKRVRASATAFYIDVQDLVQQVVLRPNLFQLQNVGRVAHTGVELDTRTTVAGRIELGLTYSYLHRESKSTPAVPLLDVPNHKFLGTVVATPWKKLQLVGAVTYESSRTSQNEAGTLQRLDGYTTVDAKASVSVTRVVALEAGGSNLFDTNYQLADGYPQAGRVGFVNLRVAFGREAR